jgi:hypothetical protein
MRITIRTSGGFAGLSETIGPIDTADLPADEAREIEVALEALGPGSPPSGPPIGADLVRYEVTVMEGARKRVLRVEDDGSGSAQAVLDLIEKIRSVR